MRKADIDKYFSFDYKAKDIDLFIKEHASEIDLDSLREHVYGSYLYFRIYFKISLKKYKTNKGKRQTPKEELSGDKQSIYLIKTLG